MIDMASPIPVQDLLEQHLVSLIKDALYSSSSNKNWTKTTRPSKISLFTLM